MSDQQHNRESDRLDQVNDVLTRSLKACHSIIDDYRSKLAANLNGPLPANEDHNRKEAAENKSRRG